VILSQWPRGLRRGSAVEHLLGLRIRNPPGAWMSVCSECCVLSGRGPCDGLITRPEESYRVLCVWVWSWSLDNGEALPHWGLLRHWGEWGRNLWRYQHRAGRTSPTVAEFGLVSDIAEHGQPAHSMLLSHHLFVRTNWITGKAQEKYIGNTRYKQNNVWHRSLS
jgi:hypothetical protein